MPQYTCIHLLNAAYFEDRIFMGFRSAPTHFAGTDSEMFIASTNVADFPEGWVVETVISYGEDVREPYLLVHNGTLYFYFLELGTNPISFDPKALLWMSRNGFGNWSAPRQWGKKGDCPWQFNIHNESVYAVTFHGTKGVTSLGQVS